ncbi:MULTISPECIES: TonB-dependent receptor plug domain-containing protein [Sphingobacterium]|uniref:TonB-dependent receptor plug domain-containing protein n=1 Tax=Sphingobacterium populi TaxID=1812824 RepID=A0ABW5UE43_9SPHI|nr:TonB-dependent receptor [Sphingobacterium sp. CFCC 11742]
MPVKTYFLKRILRLPTTYVLLTVTLLLTVSQSIAQDTIPSDTIKRKNVDEVRVDGNATIQKIKEQSYNINVIDAKQLYNSSIDINQALNRTTGVRVREDGGLGSTFNFSLNGFTGRQVKFFIDGLPMDNFGSSLSLNNLPTTMAERIEIYKGVLPVSLGADALGGAVNIVTRKNANYLDVSYGFGSFNTHKAGINGAYTDAKTGFTVRANAFYNYSDNSYRVRVRPIDLQSGQFMEEREVKRFHDSYNSIGGQVDVGLTNRSYADHLLFGAVVSGNERDIQTGVIMDQVFGARTANSSSVIPTLKYKKSDLFVDNLDFTLYSAYNLTTNNFIDTTRLRYNWLQETIPTSAAEVVRSQLKNKDNELLTTANLAYKLGEHQSLSLNYLLTDFRRQSSDVEDPNNPTFVMPQGLRKQNLGLAWQTTYGGLNATVFGKLFMLNAKSFEDVSATPTPDYQATALSRTNGGYGTAFSYFIREDWQAKASYEHTYRLPEATELLGDGLFTRRNTNLRPERSDNINVGMLYTVIKEGQHRLNLEGNFIFRNAKDYIRQDQQQSQPVDRQFINVGDVRTTGGEAEIRYVWNDRIFANVNATYQRIIDRTEFIVSENLNGVTRTPNLNYGYRIPNMPYFFGNANVGARFEPFGNDRDVLNLNYNVNFVERYYLTPSQLGLNNTDIIPQQVSHDFIADISFGNGKYIVAAECRNLLNSELFDNYRLQKPGRSFFLKLRYFITQ